MEDEPLVEDVAEPEEGKAPVGPVDQQRRRRRAPWLMLAVFLLNGLTGFLILQRRQNAAAAAGANQRPEPPAIAISTATAEQGNIGVYINALGFQISL